MLTKKYKLNKFDFLNQKKGSIITTPFFRIKIIETENLQKLGVILSKKFIKKANKRNALKRKICYAYLEINKNNPSTFKSKTLIVSLIKKEKDTEINFDNYQEIKQQIQNICGIK